MEKTKDELMKKDGKWSMNDIWKIMNEMNFEFKYVKMDE